MIFSIYVPENPTFFQDINTDFNITDNYNFISFEFDPSTNEVDIKLNSDIYRVEGNNCPIKKIYKKKNNLEIIFFKNDIETCNYIYKENEGLRKVDEYRNSMNDLIRNLEINQQSLENNEKKPYLKIIYYFLTKEIIDVYDKNGIKYIHIRNGIFAELCCKLNNFFNTIPFIKTNYGRTKNFVEIMGLGVWTFDKNEIKMIKGPFLPSNESHLNGKNNTEFIEKNKELIKNCIRHFLNIVKIYYPDIKFKSNEKYEFNIDSRWKRGSSPVFHKDGGDEFLLFIYPKQNPTATSIGKEDISKYQKDVSNNNKILPKIDQCDSIIIHNKTQTHATPDIPIKNENENMAFIRFSMYERKNNTSL